MTEKTVEKCICKPCGGVFDEMAEAVSHASGHRTKPYQYAAKGKNRVPTKNMIRFIETTETELETRTLHEIAGIEPPEDCGETVYLSENDTDTGKKTYIDEWCE